MTTATLANGNRMTDTHRSETDPHPSYRDDRAFRLTVVSITRQHAQEGGYQWRRRNGHELPRSSRTKDEVVCRTPIHPGEAIVTHRNQERRREE